MGYIRQKPIYISLPGMEVHLTTYFFGGIDDRPASKHTHPCYEIVSVENDKGVFFTIIPPLMEHFAKTAEPGKLCSILFTFTLIGSFSHKMLIIHIYSLRYWPYVQLFLHLKNQITE